MNYEDYPGFEKLDYLTTDFEAWYEFVSKTDEDVADWKNVKVVGSIPPQGLSLAKKF